MGIGNRGKPWPAWLFMAGYPLGSSAIALAVRAPSEVGQPRLLVLAPKAATLHTLFIKHLEIWRFLRFMHSIYMSYLFAVAEKGQRVFRWTMRICLVYGATLPGPLPDARARVDHPHSPQSPWQLRGVDEGGHPRHLDDTEPRLSSPHDAYLAPSSSAVKIASAKQLLLSSPDSISPLVFSADVIIGVSPRSRKLGGGC